MSRCCRSGPCSGRTSAPGSSETLSADDPVVAPTAAKSGRASSLRTEEFDLLLFVLADPGRVASAGRIDAGVPGAGIRRCAHRGRHVRWLREKIEDEPPMPELLITVWGVGYRFDAPGVCGGKVISRPVRTGRAVLECWFAGVVKARSSALR
ncbi:helix-turn-helix domain-containing protein [Saccharopolyspora sp. NPDC047091]|uniref:winged helix-turn-helix domain-containing protein n=1 Tax=Saccharopolyspora sp. NPDC047091 TaxID=3155924 RepID=UPI0033F2954E